VKINRKVISIGIVWLSALLVHACTLPKAFEAIDVYNYFQAKKLFERAEKRNPVAAKYGLSLIQQRNDNPFSNIDSAYQNITYAVTHYDSLTERKKERYTTLGITKQSLLAQQHVIASNMYKRAVLAGTEQAMQLFINQNASSSLIPDAIFVRDSIAFYTAAEQNTAASYQAFIDKYPNSVYYEEGYKKLERQLYAEHTAGEKLTDYISFIKKYPNNPFVIDAENQIYNIETESRTAASYELFINRHPKNRNVKTAWLQLYDAYLTENISSNAIADFIKKYPNSPFISDIENDLALSKTVFYPVQKNGIWGFKTKEGKYIIDQAFDYVEPFSEGLALVFKNDKVGFITKTGQVKIAFQFDDALPFSEGCAVVEVNDLYGLINRQGDFIISPTFDYLGTVKDGLIPFQKDEYFGYFDKKGQVRIQPIFEEAYDFSNGVAKVSLNNFWGLINTAGQYVFEPVFETLIEINDSSFVAEKKEAFGLISIERDTILPFEYDYIGEPSNGYYLVTQNDSFNYVNVQSKELLLQAWQPVYPEYKILARYRKTPILIASNEGYNYMQKDGKLIFKQPKSALGVYSDLIAFEKEGQWGYLTPIPAKEQIKPQFDRANSFEHGLGIVSLSPLWGIINKDGKFLIEAFYEDLQFLNSDLLLAKGKGNYGLLSVVGDTILPFTSAKIEPFDENMVKLSNKDNVSYYNYRLNYWIKKEE
jgi:hypothetical protein